MSRVRRLPQRREDVRILDGDDPVELMRRRREYVQQVVGLATDCADLVERLLTLVAGTTRLRRTQAEALEPAGVYTSREVARILKISPADIDELARGLSLPSLALPSGERRFLGAQLLALLEGESRAIGAGVRGVDLEPGAGAAWTGRAPKRQSQSPLEPPQQPTPPDPGSAYWIDSSEEIVDDD